MLVDITARMHRVMCVLSLEQMQAILHGRLRIAKIVSATAISLGEAPTGHPNFDKGAAKKFVLDPHGALAQAA